MGRGQTSERDERSDDAPQQSAVSESPGPMHQRRRRGLVALLGGAAWLWAAARSRVGAQASPHVLQPSGGIAPLGFATVVELRARAGVRGQCAIVSGYHVPGDGGGGQFFWSEDTKRADDSGICFVPQQTARTGCWLRQCTGPLNVRWFGAQGDGRSSDDQAVNAACVAAKAALAAVYLPSGVYRIKKLSILHDGFMLFGDGPQSSVLRGDTTSDHVIELTRKSINGFTLRDLAVDGGVPFDPRKKIGADRSFHGIYIHDNNFVCGGLIANVLVRGCAGAAIREEGGMFSSSYQSVIIDRCGHGFDLRGGSATTLIACFVRILRREGVAFRIRTGAPILIGCNGICHNDDGISAGTKWGEFGPGALPSLVGCNVESFAAAGCVFHGSSFGNFIGTSFVHNVGTQAVALRYAHVPHDDQLGLWDGTSRIFNPEAGSSWGSPGTGNRRHAIEASGNPFLSLNKSVAAFGVFTPRDGGGLHSRMPSLTSVYSSYLNYAFDFSRALIRDAVSPGPSGEGRRR